jgi:hypothetical protein
MASSKAYKEGFKEAKTGKTGSKAHEKKESKSYKKKEAAGERAAKKRK